MTTLAAPTMDGKDDLNALIASAADLTKRIADWKAAGFHVLGPDKFTSFAPGWAASIGAHVISTDPAAQECYYDKLFMEPNERAIGRVGLDKIAMLAGISWLPSCHRTSDPAIRNFWEFHSDGAYISYDGRPQILGGTAEVDLREGSAQIEGWSDARLRQARRFGLRGAETRSKNAAIRSLGLKPKYTLAQLEKPFIVIRFQYEPDMSDQEVRTLVAENALRGIAQMFPGVSRALPALIEAHVPDIIDVTPPREKAAVIAHPSTPRQEPVAAAPAASPSPASTAPAAPAAVAPASAAAAPAPAISPSNYIREVKREEKKYGQKHQRAGETFIKFHVIDGDGVEHVTIKTKLGEAAERYWKAETAVVITSAQNSFREQEISAIEPLGSRPAAAPAARGIKL